MVVRDLRYMRYVGTLPFYLLLLTPEQMEEIVSKLDEIIALEGKGYAAVTHYEETTPIPDVTTDKITKQFLLGSYYGMFY